MSRFYAPGDVLVLKSGNTWKVRDTHPAEGGRLGVGLVDPNNDKHGTALFADVLDDLVVSHTSEARPLVTSAHLPELQGTSPKSYPVKNGTLFVDDEDKHVVISMDHHLGPSPVLDADEVRSLAYALLAAAEQGGWK